MIEIFGQPAAAPDGVLLTPNKPNRPFCGYTRIADLPEFFIGSDLELQQLAGDFVVDTRFAPAFLAFLRWARRLVDQGWHLEPDLCDRWNGILVCSPEFAAWWRSRDGRPRGFAMEVLA